MPSFSNSSREKLLTCHPYLVRIACEVIKVYDFSIICGHRSPEEQARLYAQGRTAPGPVVTWTLHSKHNEVPSMAFDFCPWTPGIGPDWNNLDMFHKIGGALLYEGLKWGWHVRWGIEFPSPDLPHLELHLN